MVAASVLPSPVFISAIFPSCKTMPPMICSSKGRIPRVRLETSRKTAKASGSRSSMVSPPASLSRNSSVVSVTTPVYHIYITGIGAREHVEVMVEELQLEDGLLSANRLHLELLGPDYARLDLLFFLYDEGLRLVGCHVRRILQLALPAVDLAPPEALDLPLELVRHPVDGGVHVFGGLTGFQHRSVDKQRGLSYLRLGDGPVPLVDELYLGTRCGALVVEEPGDPLHLLPGVALQSIRHRDVAALDEYVHVAPPFGRREHFSTLQPSASACQHASALRPSLVSSSAFSLMISPCGTPGTADGTSRVPCSW